VFIVLAFTLVAVTVIKKNEVDFEVQSVKRPRLPLKRLQVPVNVKQPPKQPKLRKQIVAKPNISKVMTDFAMPEIAGVKGSLGAGGGGGGSSLGGIGFSMPELDFFGAKAKGEKIAFVVHFGPATIDAGFRDGKTLYTPFSRMTGLTIRNRLADLIDTLPELARFNVICFYAGAAWAFEPTIQQAIPSNKQKVKDWMAPVNPLEGDYEHCFAGPPPSVFKAQKNYPTRVDDLPFYAPKWCYPYRVPEELEKKYAPDASGGIPHWARGVAWAILEQKADTIFVLTTNYMDGWQEVDENWKITSPPQPKKMAKAFQAMCVDVYGRDSDGWPTINVVILAKAGQDSRYANKLLTSEFKPIISTFNSDGSIIDDIKKYMNRDEQELFIKYRSEYGN
jgi:hypothetical protein